MTDLFKISSKVSDKIELEAASWIAQLDSGTLSSTDKLALAEWMARSPKHAQILRQLANVWGGIDLALDDAILSKKPTHLMSVIKAWGKGRPASFATAMTATFAIVLISSAFLFTRFDGHPSPELLVYSVGKGDSALQTLSDGSTVHLNTNTSLEVKYENDKRVVRLLRGEAYFDVEHDPDRPFRVIAGVGRVEAVGTAFSVKIDGEDIDVFVTEGKVRYDRLDQSLNPKVEPGTRKQKPSLAPIYVKAGHSMEVDKNVQKIAMLDTGTIDKELAWRQGEFKFSGDSLEYAVTEMNRYSERKIVITDPELFAKRITGTFKVEDIQLILEAVELTMGINVEYVKDDLIHLSALQK